MADRERTGPGSQSIMNFETDRKVTATSDNFLVVPDPHAAYDQPKLTEDGLPEFCFGAVSGPPFKAGGTSGMCQQRTVANLLDNLVGVSDKRWRHVEAERLSGPQVDHQLVFGRLLDRQLCRFRALEDAIHIGCSARM